MLGGINIWAKNVNILISFAIHEHTDHQEWHTNPHATHRTCTCVFSRNLTILSFINLVIASFLAYLQNVLNFLYAIYLIDLLTHSLYWSSRNIYQINGSLGAQKWETKSCSPKWLQHPNWSMPLVYTRQILHVLEKPWTGHCGSMDGVLTWDRSIKHDFRHEVTHDEC